MRAVWHFGKVVDKVVVLYSDTHTHARASTFIVVNVNRRANTHLTKGRWEEWRRCLS